MKKIIVAICLVLVVVLLGTPLVSVGQDVEPPKRLPEFTGAAIVTIYPSIYTPDGCQFNANGWLTPQSIHNFDMKFVSEEISPGPCETIVGHTIHDEKVTTRATIDGSVVVNIKEWGVVRITPWLQEDRDLIKSMYPGYRVAELHSTSTWDSRGHTLHVLVR